MFRKITIRLFITLALLLTFVGGAKAQTANNAYIFYNDTYGYLINNSGNPGVNTTFNKNAIWVASGTLPNNGNTSRNIYSYIDTGNTKSTYLTRSGTSLGFANAASTYWRTSNNSLRYRASNTNNYYLKYTGTAFDLSSTANNGNRFTVTGITITENNSTPSTPTISITAASGLSNGGIQLTGNVTGSYVPTYYSATVRNQTYYWTTTTDATTTQPTGITDWSDATKTWTVTTGAAYASVSSDGLVTITGNPTGNVVVTLTITKGGYTGTQTFTLTRTAVAQSVNTETTINSFSVSPSSAALYVNESQAFTASATVNTTTYNTPAHTTLTNGGNTYRYYNGTLYTNIEDFSATSTTTATPTFAWSKTGDDGSNASLSATSGASTTVTHSTGVSADKAFTLTVEASYTGATSQTRSVPVTLYAPFVAPAFTRSGNSVILSTTSLGATIYYTIDGTTPSASNGTVYTAPLNLEDLTLPVTIKAIAVRGGESTSITEQTYSTLSLEKPVISISSTGVVTLTSSTAGATIRYTTDGTNPTSTSGTVYSGTFTVSNLTTVKAIAYKEGYADSEVASELFVSSGVSGGMVILNDREDHSWSYYSDASTPSQLHSLNPADVKITYYGDGIMMTGSADYTASSTDFITSTHTDYKVGAKVNVNGENENTFVYYKTLERGADTDAAWTFSTDHSSAASRCPYKPIPNPFQVRPRYKDRGSTDANEFTGWRGFQCWRLKSVTGGAVYAVASGGSALATGAVINAETEIYFAPNSEYGMEVELEAVWAIAYVKKANQNAENPVGTNNVGYERNFCVPTTGAGYTLYTGNGKRITNDNHVPVTISCYYPDGTAPDNTANSISNTATSLTADTKFENISINMTSNTLTLANYDIIVGRGCGASTVNNLQGINAAATDLDYTIRLESGTFNQFCFVRNGTNTTVSGRYLIKAIMGCDYDRATNTNNNLSVSPNSTLFFAQTVGFTGSSNKDQKTFDCVFKSGRYQSDQWTGSIQSGQNGYQHVAYLGQNSAQGNTYPGVRCVTVEGGEFSGMCGGRGVGSNSVNAMTPEVITFDLRIKGGTFHGAVYGGAADNPSIGSRRFIITGGEIQSWIAGGCNGTGSTTGTGATDGNSYIYVGGTTLVGGNNAMTINDTNGGQVFGAGRGISGRASSVNYSHVAIADEAVVCNNNNTANIPEGGNVYGGSYNGTIAEVSNVYILGGTVEGGAFGGSYGNGTAIPKANVTMTGGLVTDGVYGGSNSTGTVNEVIMHIDGGQVGTTGTTANIHGGGYGQPTRVNGNVEITLGTTTQTTPGVTVYGDVYGGSALGYVNGTAATNTYHTYVTMNKGVINGSLYGGGLGNAANAANVYGPVAVKVYGGSVNTTAVSGSGAVYGCNNLNGAPQRAVTVDIYGTDPAPSADTYALDAVYGGGNQADYSYGTPTVTVHNCDNSIAYVYGGGNAAHITNGNTDVTIYGGNKIGNVFGGGNGTVTAANVSGDTNVKIYGGTIGKVFGGSNSQGNIGGTINVNAESRAEVTGNTPCIMQVDELYGGGNLADSNVGNISIGCMGDNDMINYVYGGANQADITGNINLIMLGGRIGNLFGGNNTSGEISGSITVTVNWDGSCDNSYLGNVFGGGNLATFGTTASPKAPTVKILNGTVSGNVYGGGKGDPVDHTKGQVTGNPVVTIGDASRLNDNTVTAVVSGDVYGGGDAGNVVGTPQVNVINKCNTSIANVYGGGNAADVNGTDVNIDGGNITGMVFGGGHGDKNSSPQKEADVNGNVAVDVTGGTINKVFGGSNSKGNITGTVAVNIAKGANSCDMHITEVYGGGNEAAGNAGAITIGCTGDFENNGEGIGDVYGGANAADINNNISLAIRGGHIDRVFGGNNSSGSISGTIAVEVNWNDALTCGKYLGNVFGGGNVAAYTGTPTVTLTNGTVSHSVYGGGNEAGVGGSLVNINGGSVLDGVYGGCNTSGNVSGNIVVNINGGTLGTSSAPLTSGIFGGGYGSATTTGGNVTVNVGDANAASAAATSTIYGDIYGGSALGTVNDAVEDVTTVNINNGTIHGNIYGGGLGAATLNGNGYIASVTTEAVVNGTVHVNIGASSQASNFVTINGQVFGCNNLAGSPKGHVYVDVYHTAHTAANTYPSPEPTTADAVTSLASTAFAIGAVYGGGNLAHYTTTLADASTHVTIHNCDNTIEYVYGGGNAASSPATDVKVEGGRFNYIFGGGNGAGTGNPGADILRDATATINGGLIYRAFGGSNTKGNIGGTSSVVLPDDNITCTRLVHEIFGGGNEAPGGNVDLVIPCGTTGTGIIYAGANNADMGTEEDFNNGRPVLIKLTVEGGDFTQVFGGNNQGGTIWGNVELYLKGGTIENAFGGNNLGGNIKGTIKVFVDEDSSCPLVLTNVYGGGYNAAYTPADPTIESPQVYINHLKSNNKILGNVFGGGYGVPATVTANPVVTIGDVAVGNESKKATIAGNVYGGGEQASVDGNTKVIMQKTNSVVEGTIYGAGRGVATNPAAALVTKNTLVTMTGGQVQRSIYGGGELSSVGTFTEKYTSEESHPYHAVNEPKACADNTGLTEVLISGGRVGLVNQLMPDPSRPTSDDDYGYVFCAGKGVADSTSTNGYPMAHLLAVSGSSHLEISGTALIAASAYGGSENGQVLGDTYVEIKGGQIGSGHYEDGSGHHWDPVYTESQWTTAINAIKSGVVADINSAAEVFHECDAWPFGAEGNRHVYDYYHGTAGYNSQGGGKPGSDGHSYYGHVFGGGSGYYPFAPGTWRRTAGRVNGNTVVEISGGHVLTNVYGGNEITDVLGSSKVEMWGGTVGVPRTIPGIQARPVNSYIFGAGMGDPRVLFNGWSNVGSAEVIVRGDAVVFGSVFGGGEDGHVLGDVSTTIKGDALIGTFGSSGVDGNIFGSGRGFSALALTAGAVCGDVTVNIAERAKILGSIFGGGRMAAVGTYLVLETDANYGKLIAEGQDPYGTGSTTHGNVTVNITGGTIGNQSQMSTSAYSIGDVFGGSKGTLMSDWAKTQKLGLVKNTTVNISQAAGSTTTIYGNVYGGGELASVGSYNYATPAEASTYSTNHPSEPMTEGDVLSVLESGTGLATILITGGTIGQNTTTDTRGNVFGGCLGKAGTTFSGYSFVNNSDVTLQGGTVYGSIFGGGENGHVFSDTDVKIKSGSVGIALDKTSLPDANLNNNMIYRGNVYGGGRGIDKTTGDTYSITAGKVNGDTNVTVEGGIIYRNVYGGGSLASVGILDVEDNTNGNATVTIKGGQIGTDGGASANNYNTLIPDRESRRENGFVFGSGRGMAAGNTNPELARLAYTKNTIVSIEGTANVTGSVFGGGENGHVKYDTKVYVKENSFVGTELIDAEHAEDENGRGRVLYRGNVYGGGRGIDTGDAGYSLTAGRVYGDTFVEVSGGKIYHDVFGGGSLASVGNETVNPSTGEVTYGDTSGETEVHIKGGIIGYSSTAAKQGFNCGFVYGGCRGLSAPSGSDIVKMAYVHDTKVYIEPGADVKGSVFGGGANGHVKNDTYVEISGGSIGTALLSDEVGFDEHGVAAKPVFRGNVYAGGRGVDQYYTSGSSTSEAKYSLSAGAVYGNAELLMTGGQVWHNIYGSGAMASVGTVKEKAAGQHVHDEVVDGSGNLVNNVIYNPDESDINYLTGVFKEGTGKVTVTITGGTVGDTTAGHEGINNGCVYGAGRGVSADRSDYVASMEYVNETDVTIGTSGQLPSSYSGSTPDALNYPYIYGAVFGGGENGHVKTDTDVKIYSGIIGFPLVEGSSQEYKTAADGSSKNPYRGNVFGAGRGVDPVHHSTSEQRSSSAGRVYGHTNVTMTGGVVRRAIYGGGLLASVGVYRLLVDDMHITGMIEDEEDGGDATVTISGGYIGNVNPDGTALSGTNASGIAYLVPGDNNGHVFGSSCGMVADNYIDPVSGLPVDVQYRQMGYSHSTHVSISGNDTRVFGSVFGSGENGHVWEDTRIDISGGEIGYQTNSSTFIYAGNVYGSGRGVDHPHSPTGISETAGKVRGNTTVNLTGGIVWRDVYGGGSLASVGEADEAANDSKKNITTNPTTNNPFPYSTGLTRVVIDGTSAVHGSVYGSGRGVASTDAVYKQVAYVKNTLVTIKGTSHVFQNVFGGGNAGHVRKNTDVTVDGSAKVDGNVYGGGAGDISSPTAGLVNHDVAVNIKGGLIAHDVYGGGAIANSNVHDVRNTAVTECTDTNRGNAKTLVNLTGGIILGDAYGGGQGVIPGSGATAAEIANAAALVQGDVTLTLDGTAFYPTKSGGVATSGRVFGCNNLNGTPQGTVFVQVLQTKGVTKSGDTYSVNDTKPTLDTDTYEVQAVYGGGNLAAYEPWDAAATGQYTTGVVAASNPLQVLIDGCDKTSIEYVYGGGNAASAPSTQVIVRGAYELGTVFGGGNGKDALPNGDPNPGAHVGFLADGTTPYSSGSGNANVYLYGGYIHNAFGASNTLGNIAGKAEVHIDEAKEAGVAVCPLILDEVYGGGNEAYMAGGTDIDMGCITYLKAIYGGAKNADVGGDINLTITSGHFDRVFGGNNIGGVINGAITVNIEETGCNPITIGELYGCGNQARYTTPGSKHPTINVKSFTSIGRIFGGGLGTSAVVTGNPTVNINEIVGEHANNTTWNYHQQIVNGEAVGKTITYSDGTSVTMPTHESGKIGAIGTVFGGGNAAQVQGNTNVLIGTQEYISYTSDAAGTNREVKGVDVRGNVFGGGNKAEVTGNTNVEVGRSVTQSNP